MHLHTCEDIEAVLVCDLEIIVCCVRPCPTSLVGLVNIYLWNIVVHDVRVVSISKGADKCAVKVKTEVRTEQKSLHRLDVNISVTEDSPYIKTVVSVVIKLTYRVLTVTHTTYRTCECLSILFIYRDD